MKPRRSPQSGFAAIAAIVIVVLLAALGGFMLTFSNTQQLTAGQDTQGSRAYWAARAGLEMAIASVGTGATSCPAIPSITVDGFAVAIACAVTAPPGYTDGVLTLYIFQLTSVAYSGAVGGLGRVERSVSATIER